MSGFIRINENIVWQSGSGCFYDVLGFLRGRVSTDGNIWELANWGVESGTKYCDISMLTPEERSEMVAVIDDYLSQLPEIAKSWSRPSPGLEAETREEITRLRGMLAGTIIRSDTAASS